jgi:hypothetical protein
MHGNALMPRYAVKIAEIHLVSDKPITEEERKEVLEDLQNGLEGDLIRMGVVEIVTPMLTRQQP